MIRSVFSGFGYHVPERVVTNDELSKKITTSDEWIVQRTGIKERRYVKEGESAHTMSVIAARKALAQAKLEPKDVDCILFATLSPDYEFPGNAVLLQHELGCGQISAMDIRNQCSGFVYGMQTADAYIRTGLYENVLVVGAEVHSTGLDFTDRGRDVTVIFGDGAGAVLMTAAEGKGSSDDRGVLFTKVAADGVGAKELWTPAPGSIYHPRITQAMMDEGMHYPQMNGKVVFKWATEKMPEIALEACKGAGVSVEQIDWFVPHQANLRINEMVAKRLNIPAEKCWNNIVRYGNTTAATIPIGLAELVEAGKAKPGQLVLIAAFGAGFTWAGSVVRL